MDKVANFGSPFWINGDLIKNEVKRSGIDLY
jgi:hypothetical protein